MNKLDDELAELFAEPVMEPLEIVLQRRFDLMRAAIFQDATDSVFGAARDSTTLDSVKVLSRLLRTGKPDLKTLGMLADFLDEVVRKADDAGSADAWRDQVRLSLDILRHNKRGRKKMADARNARVADAYFSTFDALTFFAKRSAVTNAMDGKALPSISEIQSAAFREAYEALHGQGAYEKDAAARGTFRVDRGAKELELSLVQKRSEELTSILKSYAHFWTDGARKLAGKEEPWTEGYLPLPPDHGSW